MPYCNLKKIIIRMGNKLQLRNAAVAKDLDSMVELNGSLAGDDKGSGNPPDGVQAGEKVCVVNVPQKFKINF